MAEPERVMNDRSPRAMRPWWRSLSDATRGLRALLVRERNARIQLGIAVLVIAAGVGLGIDRAGWLAVLVMIGLVGTAEALNSAIEALGDRITTEEDPIIGLAKDLAAAAVLWSAVLSVAVGVLIFGERLLAMV